MLCLGALPSSCQQRSLLQSQKEWTGWVLFWVLEASFSSILISSELPRAYQAACLTSYSQAPLAGWVSPYEVALLVTAIAFFSSFGLWEYKFAHTPILPLTIWMAPSFFPLVLVVLISFMSYGTFIWYLVAWQQQIRHWSVLSTGIGLTPIAICGGAAAVISAWLIPHLAAQWIMALGCLAILIRLVSIATMPEQQSYWA